MPENISNKKITEKTRKHYDTILKFMEPDTWYKASDFIHILDVKERRIKVLLNELVENGFLVDEGSTKAKKYKKA